MNPEAFQQYAAMMRDKGMPDIVIWMTAALCGYRLVLCENTGELQAVRA